MREAFEKTLGRLDENVLLAEREDPEKFYVPGRPWDDLKTVYFAGYALWNYVNIPYLFTWDGFQVAEIEPWQEKEETWRRLRVQFPDYVATHSRVQTFYFGADDGLLRRQDYDVDIRGGVPRAHYTMDHVSVDGFSFPTRRRVVARNPDDTTEAQPVFVSLDIKSISLS